MDRKGATRIAHTLDGLNASPVACLRSVCLLELKSRGRTWPSERRKLRRLIKAHPDPQVRHGAQGVLMLAQGEAVVRMARAFHTAPHRVRGWRVEFGKRGVLG
jgi:hypothetical protein